MRTISYKGRNYLVLKDEYGRINNEQILIVAKCISQKSKIQTENEEVILSSLPLNIPFSILSYNTKENKIEKDQAIKINSGIKDIYELRLSNRKTIRVSKDHIFFVKNSVGITEKKLSELKRGDEIMTKNYTFDKEMEDIISYYNSGKSLRETAKKFEFKHSDSIKNRLLEYNIKLRPKIEQMKISTKNPLRNQKISLFHKGRIRGEEYRKNLSKAKKRIILDKDFLIEHYINKNESSIKIANIIGSNPTTIRQELRRNGIAIKKLSNYPCYWKDKKNLDLSKRNLLNNPSKRLEVREKMRQILKNNPKMQINNKLKRNKRTYLEKLMVELLSEIGFYEDKDYLFNKFIKTNSGFKFPDFRFDNKKIIIEVDGSFWHKNFEEEKKRDNELQEIGYRIFHFNEKEVNKNLIPKLREILI